MARTKHKARDNEVTDREQYATLVQSRLWRGRNLHILLNQRKGRKKNASKYEVLLANALLVQRVQSVSKRGGGGGHSGQKRGGRHYYLVTLKFKVLLTLICPQN